MTQFGLTGAWVCWSLAAVVLTASGAVCDEATTPAPRPGEVQYLTAVTISLKVGSTERETKRVTYSPPPGWYIRSHRVHCKRKYGNSSYSINTVPRDWIFSSEEKAKEASGAHLDVAGHNGQVGM